MSSDEIIKTRLEIDQLNDQRSELMNVLQTKQTEFNNEIQSKRSEIQKEMSAVLSKAIPSWSDEVKGSIESYAKSSGYADANVENMSALDYQMAWKAMEYDRLKSQAGSASSQAKKAPPVVKPGSVKRMPKETAKMLNFKKAMKAAKTDQEKANLIEQRMADKFS